MEKVIKYVNDRFRISGNSKEVQNQKEELIASLHDKIHDAMSKGKTEDEAFAAAVASLDGLEELTEALDGKHRMLFVNRLNFHHSLFMFAVIALELLLGIAVCMMLINAGSSSVISNATLLGLSIALFASAIIPIVSGIIYGSNAKKADKVAFDFRKAITGALFGWLAISLGLAIINIAILPLMDVKVIWFIWPMIGISNWPVSLIIYNILYKSKRYEVK